MAIKISGSTIIDDSRVVVNADKIGIGAASPNFDLEILSGSATGIAVSATNTQTTDTNKALRVFNNSGTVNFGVSYRGRVDATEYYGVFKGTIDSGVIIDTADNANKIQIHHASTNVLYNIPFLTASQSNNSYQDLYYDNSDSLQYNPNTGRLRINSSDGLDALTIRTNSNSISRGLAFQNSGDAYIGYVGMVDAGNNTGDMVFGVDDATNSNVDLVEERMRITRTGQVLIGGTSDAGHSSADDLTIYNSGHGGITIRTGTTSNGAIFFADSTSGDARFDGFVQYNHGSSPYMLFGTAGDERLRITSTGELVSTNGTLRRDASNSSFTVSGDSASNAGANINLYGASHASLANVFRVRTGSTERLRINSSGQVSVGSEPSSGQGLLNIKPGSGDDSYTKFRRAADFDGTFDGTAIDTRNSANNASKDLIVRFGKLALWANTSEKLRITATGSVNIGGDYSQTGKKLKVTGDAEVDGTLTATSFSGPLTGSASKIDVTTETSDTTCFPVFVETHNTTSQDPHTSTSLEYNSSSKILISQTFQTSNGNGTNVSSRDKYRLWNSNAYAIGFDNAMSFGGLNNYATTFQMNNQANRGWVFLDQAHTDAQGAMALTTNGKMTLAHSLRVGFGESDTTTPGASHLLDVGGNVQIGSLSTADAELVIGRDNSGNRNAYIDLIGDNTYDDYGLRIIRKNGGSNTDSEIAHRGTGSLIISTSEAASIKLATQGTE